MSIDVKCETCGTQTSMRSSMTCPENWYWAELVDDSSKEEFILMACSKECASLKWHKGATKREPVTDLDTRTMEVLSEDRVASTLVRVEEGAIFSVDSLWYRVGPKNEGVTQIENPFNPKED